MCFHLKVHTEGFRSQIQTLDRTPIQYSYMCTYYYTPTLELTGSSLLNRRLKVLNMCFWQRETFLKFDLRQMALRITAL